MKPHLARISLQPRLPFAEDAPMHRLWTAVKCKTCPYHCCSPSPSCPYYRFAEDGLYDRIPGLAPTDIAYYDALLNVTGGITNGTTADFLAVGARQAGAPHAAAAVAAAALTLRGMLGHCTSTTAQVNQD